MSYQAKVQEAVLTIWVPYPSEISAAYAEEKSKATELMRELPRHVITRAADHPLSNAFAETIDWSAVRDEFRRKAKKVDLSAPSGDFPVSFFHRDTGIMIEYRPKNK